jgi:hypothetical protein
LRALWKKITGIRFTLALSFILNLIESDYIL